MRAEAPIVAKVLAFRNAQTRSDYAREARGSIAGADFPSDLADIADLAEACAMSARRTGDIQREHDCRAVVAKAKRRMKAIRKARRPRL